MDIESEDTLYAPQEREAVMLIAQMSDFHVTMPGELAYGHVDTNGALCNAVSVINALRPAPDLVIGSGDLTQTGLDGEYDALADILCSLDVRFVPVLGNHDKRVAFRRRFTTVGDSIEQTHFIQYAVDIGDLRLLVLDTVEEGSDDPEFCEARVAWLAAQLTDDRPTVIAMHHPPFASGIGWLDPANPHWSDPIGDLIERAPNVVRLICGHVHRGIHRTWRGVPVSAAPSTAHQVALDLTPGASPLLSLEAPGLHLHRWDGRDLTTYAVAIPGFSDRFPPNATGSAR
jgi:3',5'-cyclic AMP phosphodiesterase CpdA